MLNLEIISAGQAKQDKQTNKPGKIFILQNKLQSAKTDTERAIIMREWMELEDMSDEIITTLAPKTPDEIRAEQKLVLINNNNPLGAKIDSLDEDHYTFIRIFETADHNETKTKALQNRYNAIKENIALGNMQQSIE